MTVFCRHGLLVTRCVASQPALHLFRAFSGFREGEAAAGLSQALVGLTVPHPTIVMRAPRPTQVAISTGNTFQMSAGRMQGTGFSLCGSMSPLSPRQGLEFLLSSPSWPNQEKVIFRNTLKPHPFKQTAGHRE